MTKKAFLRKLTLNMKSPVNDEVKVQCILDVTSLVLRIFERSFVSNVPKEQHLIISYLKHRLWINLNDVLLQ